MKYKVINPNPFAVGLKSIDGLKDMLVPANSFQMVEEDEIYFTNSVCRLFRQGTIYVDNEEIMLNMGYGEKNLNTISDEEIIKLLKGKQTDLEKTLKSMERFAYQKVVMVAKTLDLPYGKLQVIEKITGIPIIAEMEEDSDTEQK